VDSDVFVLEGELVELVIVTTVTDRDFELCLSVNDCGTALDEAAGHVRQPDVL
jgi:hypothetical protein